MTLPDAVRAQLPAAVRVMARCDELAGISASPEHIERCYLSPEHMRANQRVIEWMTEAGMTARVDAVGNAIGELAPEKPALMLGSHLDTVPNAGRYDGILGVLAGIEIAAQHATDAPFGLEVIGFGEEEGVRFGTTLITSLARAGAWNADWLALTDADGATLADALTNFGLDASAVDQACTNKDVVGFLELHIEQGPVLEARALPVGVVSGIAGARRFAVTLTGLAGHAGTVPMDQRRDALLGAARCIDMTERLAREAGVVATVGRLIASPGAVNVIPGQVAFSLDVRSLTETTIDRFLEAWWSTASAIADELSLDLAWQTTHHAAGVPCSSPILRAMQSALESLGTEPFVMPSGAGHDAMAMAHLTEVGMLFLRCEGGLSHHPDERVTTEDVAWGLAALKASTEQLAMQYKEHR